LSNETIQTSPHLAAASSTESLDVLKQSITEESSHEHLKAEVQDSVNAALERVETTSTALPVDFIMKESQYLTSEEDFLDH
jgi:hypothetical protein